MPRKEAPWSIKRHRGAWYYKLRGDKGYHSTGIRVDNWKQTKPKAELFAQEQAGAGPAAALYPTLGDFAAPYFLPGSCPWFAREHGRGNAIQEHYRDQHRAALTQHILPQFGRLRPEELSSAAVERWLYSLDYASQTQKHFLETFSIVLKDMRRQKLISFDPAEIAPPIVRHAEREIPTDAEAARLFPTDFKAFKERWGPVRWRMGVLLALAYSTGMRTSELRALRWPAMHASLGGLVVVVTINKDGRPGAPKSKSVRAIPVPRWTLRLVEQCASSSTRGDNYVFPGRTHGTHLDIGSAGHALRAVCGAAGIPSNLTPHGLRHAYNTRMRAILAESEFAPFFDAARGNGFQTTTAATDAVLRAFTGHRTPNMTELYDHPELIKALRFFDQHFREYIERYWDFRDGQETGKSKETSNGKDIQRSSTKNHNRTA